MAHSEQWQEQMIDGPRRALRQRMAARLERLAETQPGPDALASRRAALLLEGEEAHLWGLF